MYYYALNSPKIKVFFKTCLSNIVKISLYHYTLIVKLGIERKNISRKTIYSFFSLKGLLLT